MKIKSATTGLIIATTMLASVGISQAVWAKKINCTGTGWHMVSKSCPIHPAENWQEYASGIYTQPITGQGFMPMSK